MDRLNTVWAESKGLSSLKGTLCWLVCTRALATRKLLCSWNRAVASRSQPHLTPLPLQIALPQLLPNEAVSPLFHRSTHSDKPSSLLSCGMTLGLQAMSKHTPCSPDAAHTAGPGESPYQVFHQLQYRQLKLPALLKRAPHLSKTFPDQWWGECFHLPAACVGPLPLTESSLHQETPRKWKTWAWSHWHPYQLRT